MAVCQSHRTRSTVLSIDLPAIVRLPPDRILFTVGGFRYPDAEASGRGTYFDLMRKGFRSKAESLGYEVIDLDARFFEHYAAHTQRFEYPHMGDSSIRTMGTG
jgi:hypothetical protein